jgi:hypothetical protein
MTHQSLPPAVSPPGEVGVTAPAEHRYPDVLSVSAGAFLFERAA